jgi:hypothetical protein
MLERWREYRYRQIVPMTHAEYLAEPVQTVTWTLAFDRMVEEIRSDA